MKVVFIILGLMLLFFILQYLFPIVQVCGDSMYPTYLDGEIIIGTRLYRKSKLKHGDVILYNSPTENKRIVIKRVFYVKNQDNSLSFYCLGDNSDNSYDSRYYGYVSSKSLVCKVINHRRKI